MSDPVVWVWNHQLEELNDRSNGKYIYAWGNKANYPNSQLRHAELKPLYTHPPIERTDEFTWECDLDKCKECRAKYNNWKQKYLEDQQKGKE